MSPTARATRRLHDTTLRTGLGVVVVALLLGYVALSRSVPLVGGDGGRLVHLEVPSAAQVNEDTPVRVRGVEVGLVEDVRLDRDREVAIIDARVGDTELRADASAAVRWRTMLGGRMEIDLDPGTAGEGLAGDTIGLERTTSPVELDDVLQLYDGATPRDQRAMLDGLAGGLRGGEAGRAVDSLPRLEGAGAVLDAARGTQSDDVEALVASSARLLRAVDRPRDAAGRLVGGAARTFAATSRRRRELGATFASAPGALRETVAAAGEIDATLPVLDRTVGDLRPAARRLDPAARAARPAMAGLDVVLREARPLLRDLRPAVDRLADASASGRRVLTGIDPIVRRAADDFLPFLRTVDDDIEMPVWQLIGPTLASMTSSASEFNDLGTVLHFPALGGLNTLSLPCTALVTDPTATELARCGDLREALGVVLGAGRKGAGR